MGNGIRKLNLCFAGDAGEMSRRRHDIAVCLSDSLDEGLGHSYCYIGPDPVCKTNFSDDPTAAPTVGTAFCAISGASISANASTPLTTALIDIGPYSNASSLDKASAFESSNLFSSIPLQPIPRNSVSSARSGPLSRFSCSGSGPIGRSSISDPRCSISSVRSGPIPRLSGSVSGPIEGGFLSGPIERIFISGPLENQPDQFQRYRPKKPKKWAYFNSFKKVLSKSVSGSKILSWPVKHNNNNNSNNDNNNRVLSSATNSNSNSLSSQASIVEEEEDDDDDNNESFVSENVQWAQGKAGEDRVHIVISEEHGWVFVGIYDGFNGPDATDFLLNNLYSNVYKELKGLLWHDKSEASKNSVSNESSYSSGGKDSNKDDQLGWKSRENLNKLRSVCEDNKHLEVLKALSEGLRKTEESYLEIADMMVMENPELALMGSCVLVMLMKGEDVYLLNVGDSRAVLARKPESDRWTAKAMKGLEQANERRLNDLEAFDGDEFCYLTSYQLTMDHCTSVKEEVQRIRRAHSDDVCAVVNDRVKGSLKVTRAFGAGFLKQPKWNNALLEMFRIDYIGTSPYITCCPFLYHHRLGERDKFLILSSDGLYQYFTNEEAVSEVETFMSTFPEGDPAQHLVEEVLIRAAKRAGMDFHALLDIPQGDRRKYHDDVSIIIISFEERIWRAFV